MAGLPTALARAPASALAAAIDDLRALLGDRLSTSASVCGHHGKDLTYHPGMSPDGVAFALSTQEVSAIARICHRHGVPMIPFGAGTSLEGHFAALAGGICVDLSGMKAILRVSQEDLDVTVEAGVTRKQLNDHLRDTGLFFPIDPGADATLGGMAATRASGTNAVRYGTMREAVLSLTVVLADGRVIRTARRARKSSAGYDLTRLFVGSEGTLGFITQVTLRVHGIPEAISAAVCSFETIGQAVASVVEIVQLGIPVARVELIDEMSMRAINAYAKLDYRPAPTLFFEFHGSQRSVTEQAERAAEVTSAHGGGNFRWTTRPEERSALWQARHDAYFATLALRPGASGWSSDVCVPIGRLAECLVETKADLDEAGLLTGIVGHVGDGNFHVLFLIDPDNPDELAQAMRLNEKIVMRAIAMDGTCSGEHGVGYGKIGYLEAEHGEALSVMRLIKQALDPKGLMNPGKIIAAGEGVVA